MKLQEHNTFGGPDAVLDYLDPENVTPLVELPATLNPFLADDVHIFAKIFERPNIKFLPAIYMMEDAKSRGKLKGVHTIVEASSGNTVYALHLIKDRYGIRTIVPLIPWDIAPGKAELLRLHRIECMHHDGDGIIRAREMGKQKGWLNLDQYSNAANTRAHEAWTGPQIYEQTGGDITVFCAGLGTTATMEGVARCLRHRLGEDKITTVSVLCEEGSAVPGVRSESGLAQIRFDWRKWSDTVEKVKTREAYVASRQMFLQGIPAGPSSGLALRGLLNWLGKVKKAGHLDKYRNRTSRAGKKDQVVAVFVCPDAPEKYLEKYSVFLDPGDFRPEHGVITA